MYLFWEQCFLQVVQQCFQTVLNVAATFFNCSSSGELRLERLQNRVSSSNTAFLSTHPWESWESKIAFLLETPHFFKSAHPWGSWELYTLFLQAKYKMFLQTSPHFFFCCCLQENKIITIAWNGCQMHLRKIPMTWHPFYWASYTKNEKKFLIKKNAAWSMVVAIYLKMHA